MGIGGEDPHEIEICGVGSTADEARGYVASAMEGFYQVPYDRFETWSPAGSPEHIAEFLAPTSRPHATRST